MEYKLQPKLYELGIIRKERWYEIVATIDEIEAIAQKDGIVEIHDEQEFWMDASLWDLRRDEEKVQLMYTADDYVVGLNVDLVASYGTRHHQTLNCTR